MATADIQVPSHHKAIVYDKPGEISTKIETIETPKPGVGEVLINLTHVSFPAMIPIDETPRGLCLRHRLI